MIKGGGEAALFHYYLQRGHSKEELESLTTFEQIFYIASMEVEAEAWEAATKNE